MLGIRLVTAAPFEHEHEHEHEKLKRMVALIEKHPYFPAFSLSPLLPLYACQLWLLESLFTSIASQKCGEQLEVDVGRDEVDGSVGKGC